MERITNILMCCVFLTAHLWKLTESIQRCKHFPNPANGRVVCDSLFRLFCTPECVDGFMFEFKPAVVYMCGPMTGEWFTYPEGEKVPWPDCIRRGSSKVHAMEDEVASRRAQISQKIHDTHRDMFPRNRPPQPVQPGQPGRRYLHLFSYIQRAQKMYNNKQSGYLGLNALEQRRQQKLRQRMQQKQRQLQIQQQMQKKQRELQLQQRTQQKQRQRQLQIQQQMQKKRKLIQQQKAIQTRQNFQREMIQREWQQRQAINLPITNQQKNAQMSSWRGTAYQNTQENLQPWRGVVSHSASPGHATFTYHPKMPEIPSSYSPYQAFQTNNEGQNVVSPVFQQRHFSNPKLNSHFIVSTKQTGQSSQSKSQDVERNDVPANPQRPLVPVSRAVTHLWNQTNSMLNSHFMISPKQTGLVQSSQSQRQNVEQNNIPTKPRGPLVSVSRAVTPLRQQSYPQLNPHSMVSPKQIGFVQPLKSHYVERNNMPAKPQQPLVSVSREATPLWQQSKPVLLGSPKQTSFVSQSQDVERNLNMPVRPQGPALMSVSRMAATPTWQRSRFNEMSPNSNQGDNKVQHNVKPPPRQDYLEVVRAISQPTNQITSTSTGMNITNQSGTGLSKANMSFIANPSRPLPSQVENKLNVSFKSEPPPMMLTKTAGTQQKNDTVRSASYMFQTHHESPPSLNPNQLLNTTSEVERRKNMVNEPNIIPSQEKPKKKEKLFYFPIKRDTLIRMLPINLQEKYRSLRQARNINSSYETSSNKENVTTHVLEDIGFKNITQNIDAPANISNYGYIIRQPNELAPSQSKSQTFNLSRISSSYSEKTVESNTARVNASEASKPLNDNVSAEQSSNTSIIEEYKPIPLQ